MKKIKEQVSVIFLASTNNHIHREEPMNVCYELIANK